MSILILTTVTPMKIMKNLILFLLFFFFLGSQQLNAFLNDFQAYIADFFISEDSHKKSNIFTPLENDHNNCDKSIPAEDPPFLSSVFVKSPRFIHYCAEHIHDIWQWPTCEELQDVDTFVAPWDIHLDQKLFDAVAKKEEPALDNPDRFKKLFDFDEQRHNKICTLIAAKANLNYRNTQPGELHGQTALFVETSRPVPHLGIIQSLLDARANPEQEILPIPPNHRPTGYTPLYTAVKNNKTGEALALMLQAIKNNKTEDELTLIRRNKGLKKPINSEYYYDYESTKLHQRIKRKYAYFPDDYNQVMPAFDRTSLLMIAIDAHNSSAGTVILENVDAEIATRPVDTDCSGDGGWHPRCRDLLYVAMHNKLEHVGILLIERAKKNKSRLNENHEDYTKSMESTFIYAVKNAQLSCALEALNAWASACAQSIKLNDMQYKLYQAFCTLLAKIETRTHNEQLYDFFVREHNNVMPNYLSDNNHFLQKTAEDVRESMRKFFRKILEVAAQHANVYFLKKCIEQAKINLTGDGLTKLVNDYWLANHAWRDDLPYQLQGCRFWNQNDRISSANKDVVRRIFYAFNISEGLGKEQPHVWRKYREWTNEHLKDYILPQDLISIVLDHLYGEIPSTPKNINPESP